MNLTPVDAEGLATLQAILRRPGPLNLDAVDRLRHALPSSETPEAWNSLFGPGSLFDAWTQTPLVQGIYDANARTLRDLLAAREDPVFVEVGGGDGRLWSKVFEADSRATLVVVDPHPVPHERIAAQQPPGVRVQALKRGVEHAQIPEADAIVCSLTLHHLAGVDTANRSRAGMCGPGKLEVLARFARSLIPRCGVLLLNEADVDCEIDLPPGDPYLRAQIGDSYIRRCAASLTTRIALEDDPDLAARWWRIVHRWCLDQLDVAQAPLAERDVYELSVPRWLHLLRAAGFAVLDHRFTDDVALFHRYLAVPAQARSRRDGLVPGISPGPSSVPEAPAPLDASARPS